MIIMKSGGNKEERKAQKEVLRSLYKDYNPIRHDVFVDRFIKEAEDKAIQEYMKNRGII
jgi:hypothetical protein